MRRMGIFVAGFTVVLGLLFSVSSSGLDGDAYTPLKLYSGSWEVTMSAPEKKIDQLENHCAQTGLFFACEQKLNGKSAALVVFLPTGKDPAGVLEYRTQALISDASAAGEWGHLSIAGDTWLYTWETGSAGKKVQWRNTNSFSGKDKVHFEVQNSEDGATWRTQVAGDEQRRKQNPNTP